jgi:flagellar biosynthesis protein FlhF
MAGVDEKPISVRPNSAPVASSNGEALDQLRVLADEVRQIKSFIASGEAEDDSLGARMLQECGVAPELLGLPNGKLAAVRDRAGLAAVLAEVMEKHTSCPTGSRSVIALVGPTGVGKTTTLAKLAARYALAERKKVALITCDTFRIGGVEQIRVYARILNVPLEVVTSPRDMAEAIEKHADKDVILIDTIGRSQKNALHLGELKALLAPAKPSEVYLVLSACSSQSVQMDVVKSFSVLSPNRLVISKLDESDTLGCIVSLPMTTGLPISCVTNGQNVPDDLRIGEPKILASLVVGAAQ